MAGDVQPPWGIAVGQGHTAPLGAAHCGSDMGAGSGAVPIDAFVPPNWGKISSVQHPECTELLDPI